MGNHGESTYYCRSIMSYRIIKQADRETEFIPGIGMHYAKNE